MCSDEVQIVFCKDAVKKRWSCSFEEKQSEELLRSRPRGEVLMFIVRERGGERSDGVCGN